VALAQEYSRNERSSNQNLAGAALTSFGNESRALLLLQPEASIFPIGGFNQTGLERSASFVYVGRSADDLG
jgi:hypothetical protein